MERPLQPGDPGYVVGQTHGLIAAVADQSAGIEWALPAFESTFVPGGTSEALGAGSANTDAIIAQNGSGGIYAARSARAWQDGSHTDWYLPSRDELNKLYPNRVAIGGFASTGYWSSSEIPGIAKFAWLQRFNNGVWADVVKGAKARVRAVRAF